MVSSGRGILWVAATVAVTAAVPAFAQSGGPPSTASYSVVEPVPQDIGTFRWYLDNTTSTDVTIAQGGAVTFTAPPSPAHPHNVHFDGAVKPACRINGSDVPVPGVMPSPPARDWTGTCTFAQAGAYHFVCDYHPAMTGTITVAAAPAPSSTPVPAPPPAGSTPPTQPTARPPAAMRLTVRHHQHGRRVRGSLFVSRPGTRIDIALLSRRVALGLSGRRRIRIGHALVASAAAGPLRFSVTLNAVGRRALRRRGTLPVLVRVKATAPSATPAARGQAVRLSR